VNEVGRACDTHGRGEKSVQGFCGKASGERSLGRLRHRWENGIRMDLWDIGSGSGVHSVGLGWGPVASFCEYSDEPLGSGTTELVSSFKQRKKLQISLKFPQPSQITTILSFMIDQ
jgi:hypothetical protein